MVEEYAQIPTLSREAQASLLAQLDDTLKFKLKTVESLKKTKISTTGDPFLLPSASNPFTASSSVQAFPLKPVTRSPRFGNHSDAEGSQRTREPPAIGVLFSSQVAQEDENMVAEDEELPLSQGSKDLFNAFQLLSQGQVPKKEHFKSIEQSAEVATYLKKAAL